MVPTDTVGQVTTSPVLLRRAVDRYLERGLPVMLDTETTGLNPRRDKPVALQLYQDGGQQALILDCRSLQYSGLIIQALERLFEGALIVGHNLKFDCHVLLQTFGVMPKRMWDTSIAEKVLVGMGGQEGVRYGLKDVAKTYHPTLDMSKAERAWFYKVLPNDPALWTLPFPEEEVAYMALDVTVLPRIREGQDERLKGNLRAIFDLEMQLLPALVRMERRGMRVDLDKWRAVIADKGREASGLEGKLLDTLALPILQKRLETFDQERAALDQWERDKDAEVEALRAAWDGLQHEEPPAWGTFKTEQMKVWREKHPRPTAPKQDTSLPNINSQDQLVTALTAQGIPVPTKKNDKGEVVPTLQADKLAPLEAQFPLIKLLSRYRKAQKFVDAFGESLLAQAEGDIIYPNYNAIGAATGRMSCDSPNWQQVPSRGDGKRLREAVIPRDGSKLVVADFSNIELRILAALCQAPELIAMFVAGVDLHEAVARQMFALGPEVDVRVARFNGIAYRDIAKQINYGLAYGMSEFKLASMLRISVDEARALMNAYFATMPKVREYLDQAGKKAADTRVSHTISGRARRYPEWRQPENTWLERKARGRVERQGKNAPIQGTNADITKQAIVLFEQMKHDHCGLVAVVHDELVAESEDAWTEATANILEDAMDQAQRMVLGTKLPAEALPRPVAVVGSYWSH